MNTEDEVHFLLVTFTALSPVHHFPADKPGPPASVKTTKVFSDRVKLRWEPPLADGGSEITNYIIEKRETSRANWALVTSNIHGHITDCSVEKLIEGHEYQFRVSAENQYGVGDPIMTEPVTVKNPYGESSSTGPDRLHVPITDQP